MTTRDRRPVIEGARERLLHDVAARMPAPLGRNLLFLAPPHRFGRFRHPVTCSEKVNWRILYDRRELIRVSCDKLATKERARQLGLAVPETVWCGADLAELASIRLPDRWVLKPTCGSGLTHFGSGSTANVPALRAATRDLPARAGRSQRGEWAYSGARPLFMLEVMLGDEGIAPHDVKVFAFDGEPALIEVHEDRFTDHRWRLYTTGWHALAVRSAGSWGRLPPAPIRAQPSTRPLMLSAVRTMAEGYDLIRVDLYSGGGIVYVGELTPYPCGGLARFVPRAVDTELGRLWHLATATETAPGAPAAGAR